MSTIEMIPRTASPATTFRMVNGMAAMVSASPVLERAPVVSNRINLLANRLVPAAR